MPGSIPVSPALEARALPLGHPGHGRPESSRWSEAAASWPSREKPRDWSPCLPLCRGRRLNTGLPWRCCEGGRPESSGSSSAVAGWPSRENAGIDPRVSRSRGDALPLRHRDNGRPESSRSSEAVAAWPSREKPPRVSRSLEADVLTLGYRGGAVREEDQNLPDPQRL